jgi:hypothetical protein
VSLHLGWLKVIGVKGLNPTGSTFIAQQLITHVIPAVRQKEVQHEESTAAAVSTLRRNLSMVMAAGPFSTSDNMLYEPLTELLRYCSGEASAESFHTCTCPRQILSSYHVNISTGFCVSHSPVVFDSLTYQCHISSGFQSL